MKKISLNIHIGENSSRDWCLILLCFAVLLVIVVIIDLSFYRKFSTEGPNTNAQNVPNQTFNRIDFDEVVKIINDKNQNPPLVPKSVTVDPSI